MGDIIMGVIILFAILIGVFGFMLIEDQLVHKDYPIIDQTSSILNARPVIIFKKSATSIGNTILIPSFVLKCL